MFPRKTIYIIQKISLKKGLLSHPKCVSCHSQGKQPVQKHKQNERWKTLWRQEKKGCQNSPFSHLLHLPERASHSPDKAPLALHMGFQVFRAFADKPQKPLADSTVSYLHRQNIKRTAETALFSYHHLSIYFYRFTIIQARKLFTLSRKPLYYHENSLSVSVIIQAVSVFVYGFCLRVSTFAW